MGDNVNRNFNPFVSKKVSDTVNCKAAERKKGKKAFANLQESVKLMGSNRFTFENMCYN